MIDFKQLKVMALALSLPGAIFVAGFAYEYVNEKNLIATPVAIGLFGLMLLIYIALIVRVLFKKKNE